MPTVELIYDNNCPNAEAARTQLTLAFNQIGMLPKWQEWERSSSDSPDYACQYGSPTILIDGKDVAGVLPNQNTNSCRLYPDEKGEIKGVPSLESIVSVINRV